MLEFTYIHLVPKHPALFEHKSMLATIPSTNLSSESIQPTGPLNNPRKSPVFKSVAQNAWSFPKSNTKLRVSGFCNRCI